MQYIKNKHFYFKPDQFQIKQLNQSITNLYGDDKAFLTDQQSISTHFSQLTMTWNDAGI